MNNALKEAARELLLKLGVYYKVNDFRFRHDERNMSQRAFYAGVIENTDLIFDVGANIGQRTAIFAELGRKVVAVEPQPICVRHLKSRFRFNRRVTIEEIALADTEGGAKMWQSNSTAVASMSRTFIEQMGQAVFPAEKWDKEIQVPTRTLDLLVATHGLPAFLKIDVEGYEAKVLRGLSHPVPLISFEYTPMLMDDVRECVERINQISSAYRYNYCLGEDLRFVLTDHVDYATFMAETVARISVEKTFGDIYAVLE